MIKHGDSGVPTSSGIPAIIFACALGVPSAFIIGLFGSVGQGLGGISSELTLPKMSIMGACLGAGLGGLVALLCGFHLRRGFCYLFGAAFGSLPILIFSGPLAMRDDPHQLLKDAIALGVIFLGVLAGAVVRRFVTRFGAKSRVWAGISAAVFLPLGAALTYFAGESLDLVNHPGYILFLLPGALIAANVGGWIGALAGAIRDSA